MIRVLFISRINLLAGRTNVYNFAKTCEAVNAEENFHAKLVTTDQDRDRDIFFRKTGVHKPFDVMSLQITNTLSKYGGQTWYEIFVFILSNLCLSWFLLMHIKGFDVIYFRDESLSPTAVWAKVILRKKVFFEIHSVLESPIRQILNRLGVRYADGVIAISSGLKRYYTSLNSNILLSLCSAPDDSWFDHSKGKELFREELGLPMNMFLIGYTGVVGANPNNDYYEIDDIVKSLVSLPTNVVLVIVGELNNNAEWLRKIALENNLKERVIIVPWLERSEIPKYLQAFNVVLIPKRKKDLIGDSPAKMFPALASRRPIIAGRAECIEEVLTDGVDALIVERNNSEGWAKAIRKIYDSDDLAKKLSDQAWVTKGKYTWDKRGTSITTFIENLTNHQK